MAPEKKKDYVHPSHVVALYDYSPTSNEKSMQLEFIPDYVEGHQLPLERGEVLNVLSESLDWWIRCLSTRTGNEGYVSTVFCAPVQLGDSTVRQKKTKKKKKNKIIHDMTFFTHAPLPSKKKVTPERTANIFSRLTFWWLTSLIIKGFRRLYDDDDIWDLYEKHETGYLYDKFNHQWKREMEKLKRSELKNTADSSEKKTDAKNIYKPSITKSLIREHGCYFFLLILSKIAADCCHFAGAFFLRNLLRFINEGSDDIKWGYIYAGLLLAVAIIQTVFNNRYFYGAFIVGMEVKSALSASIYRKMLLLNNDGRRKFTAGEMVNMMSVDVYKILYIITFLGLIITGPLTIVGSMIFLYDIFGYSTFAGLAVLLIFVFFNIFASKYEKRIKSREMVYKDCRVKLLNEMLGGIKVLKLYAWEESFMESITQQRRKELQILLKSSIFQATVTFIFNFTPFLVSLVTFTVYVLTGNELTAEKAFTGLALFNILKFPLTVMPLIVVGLMDANVAVKRIAKILKGDELEPSDVTRVDDSWTIQNAVEVENGIFKWDKTGEPVLKNIDFKIPKGSLVAVVGQVGCGKSSLISALLGEIHKVSGNIQIQGSIAYVAQEPWIQNKTLRENVLFNNTYHKEKYQAVVESCALKSDLEAFRKGDETQIGEKGINLSGGQKQRVSIARAVYNNADIYIFDDPLSAVDAHVGNHIFKAVIGNEGLLREKTRIFVTHNLSYLTMVDRIVVLKDKEIAEIGTYQELVENNGNFAEFLKLYSTNAEGDEVPSPDSSDTTAEELEVDTASLSPDLLSYHGDNEKKIADILAAHAKLEERRISHSGSIIKAETSAVGQVKLSVFYTYARSLGSAASFFAIFFSLVSQGFVAGSRFWLSHWSSQDNVTTSQRDYLLGVYGALGSGQVVSLLIYTMILYIGSISAARHIHGNMLRVIMRCPMSLFDTTPLGRILNIFSKDINVIDELLPKNIVNVLMLLSQVLCIGVMISYSTPIFLAALAPILIAYYCVQRFYVASSRQLKRMESVRRSPIFNHFLESIHGASTIRAFGYKEKFVEDNAMKVDFNQMAYYASFASNRWIAMRLEFCGMMMVFFAALFCVIQRENLSAGIAGMSITFALESTAILNFMVRNISELEVNLISVERATEYLGLKSEAAYDVKEIEAKTEVHGIDNPLVHQWPSQGVVSFKNYSTRYREGLDLALKDVTFTTKTAEKIGIVGRTGAGKSSVTLGLFRIIEPASGTISIDGVDITTLPLKELRSKLSIIPQDPVLFSGTIRFNLDPFNTQSDFEVWKALEVAHLKTFFEERKDGLNFEVEEAGSNLSVGQRQLVCLARALLRKSKILVLDEATAAVDMETDALIQETIQVEFKDSTILTIAHRLNTILYYDRILVLDEGRIAEFDTPQQLLSKPGGKFYTMVEDAGLLDSAVNENE